MSDSTNINQLPTESTSGGSINPPPPALQNAISQDDQAPVPGIDNSQVMALDNSTIQQIVNGIQKANATGSTSLPSRDIQMSDEAYLTDAQQNINYIPAEKKYDLEINQNEEEVVEQFNYHKNNEQWYDDYYEMFKIPILILILFFLFQVPVVKKTFTNTFPFFVKEDGNLKLNGMLLYSAFFGSIYFLLNKLLF